MKPQPLLSPFSSSRGNVRDLIIEVLSRAWPLNGREIYRAMKRDLPTKVTYQGVHKALKQLLEEDMVVQEDRKYKLNMNWAREMKKFGWVLK